MHVNQRMHVDNLEKLVSCMRPPFCNQMSSGNALVNLEGYVIDITREFLCDFSSIFCSILKCSQTYRNLQR